MTLSCNASGDPVPTVSWTKDGSIISANGDSRISFGADNKELNIANVSTADEGEYRCVANSSLGNAYSNAAVLNVQCKFSLKYGKCSRCSSQPNCSFRLLVLQQPNSTWLMLVCFLTVMFKLHILQPTSFKMDKIWLRDQATVLASRKQENFLSRSK